MIRDPIVEEIHEIRAKMLEECGGDLEALMDRIQASEKQHADRLVSSVKSKPKEKRKRRRVSTPRK